MAEKKPYVPSEIAQAILNVLTAAKAPMSLADINAVLPEGMVARTGHISTLVKQKLIIGEDARTVCSECGHVREFKVYSLI
jgi:predicted transcriptional regulator